MSYPYVYLDRIYLKRNFVGNFENVATLIAIAVNEEGEREVIGTVRIFEKTGNPSLASFAILRSAVFVELNSSSG